MIDRDRAWRRRKARTILNRTEETKEVLQLPITPAVLPKGVSPKEAKTHRHGALTHVQQMRQDGALNQQITDGPDLPAIG